MQVIFNEFKTHKPIKENIIEILEKHDILVDENLQPLEKDLSDYSKVILEATQSLWHLSQYHLRRAELVEENSLLSVVNWTLNVLTENDLTILEKVFLEEHPNKIEFTTKISQVAEKLIINRSVAVMSIRKVEVAQIIETKSRGMQGTWIKVINPYFRKRLREVLS